MGMTDIALVTNPQLGHLLHLLVAESDNGRSIALHIRWHFHRIQGIKAFVEAENVLASEEGTILNRLGSLVHVHEPGTRRVVLE